MLCHHDDKPPQPRSRSYVHDQNHAGPFMFIHTFEISLQARRLQQDPAMTAHLPVYVRVQSLPSVTYPILLSGLG